MRDGKRKMIISLAQAGYGMDTIAEQAGVAYDSVERVLSEAGLSHEALLKRVSSLENKARWSDSVDALTDLGFAWAERVMSAADGDDKLKFALFKLLLEHRPDHHFSKTAKIQVGREPESQNVIGGASIVELRRFGPEPPLSEPLSVEAEVVHG